MTSPVSNVSALESTDHLVTPQRLRTFFAPQSVAIVGGSDTSGWAANVVDSLRVAGFDGPLVPVHPQHESAFGLPTCASLRELDEAVDLAFVMTPPHVVEDVLDDAAAAGVYHLIVLASDYAEAGDDGRERERHLIDHAAERGITLLGPNCLGFINASAHVAPYGLLIPPPLQPGPVGVVLQSGALASAVLGFAQAHAVGVSLLASMGNEGMITTADVLEYLIDDANTQVVALFLESIRQPERFRTLAAKAAELGKPIVALKVGRSPAGQRAALAHTGAVAGNEAIVDAALRQLGVIRVDSLEELLVTAGFLAYCRVPTGKRMGVVTASGGACDIIADRAHEEGIDIPDFVPETSQRLEQILPSIADADNPLDVTGYGLAHGRQGASTIIDDTLGIVTHDPNVDFVFFLGVNIPEQPPHGSETRIEQRVAGLSSMIQNSPVPVVPVANTCTDLKPFARDMLERSGLHLVGGIEFGMTALGHALRWSAQHRRSCRQSSQPAIRRLQLPSWVSTVDGPWSEVRAREFLTEAQVPTIPAELVTSAEQAAEAAKRMGFPVVLKICSAQITHKSDIGGVDLGLSNTTGVRKAYARIHKAARSQCSDAEIDGVLVSPMRTGGIELLVGVTLDPTFGPVLALGLGGIWVETLQDTSLRLLPVSENEVRAMLSELRGAALLHGARGTAPADLDKITMAVTKLAVCAEALGSSLQELEVNPLWVDGNSVEALDVLITTRSGT